MNYTTDFLQHFAEEFLAQINGWMEKFSLFNRKGNLSSNNDSTSDNFKMAQG